MAYELSVLINWVLTSTGFVLSLISSYVLIRRYRREKPIIKIKVNFCAHEIKEFGIEPNTSLTLFLTVDNLGERGTAIKDIEIKKPELEYSISVTKNKSGFSARTSKTLVDLGFPYYLSPHNSIPLRLKYTIWEKLEEEKINFEFNLVHTHNKHKFEATSTTNLMYANF